jgi:hypothetical protein
MSTIHHYSPSELLEIYPQATKLGWTPAKLGSYFRGGLLVGFISGKENKAFITEKSFIKLMHFVSEVNRDRDLLD